MQCARNAGLLRGMVMASMLMGGILVAQPLAAQSTLTVVPPVESYSDGFFDLSVIENGVMEQLDALGIALEEVTEITYYLQMRSTSDDNDQIVGAEAILRLEGCEQGYLAMNFTAGGYFRQAYTRFGCQLAGVSAY